MATTTDATHYLPQTRSLDALREAARGCRACDLYLRATQTVFGEGPCPARLMLVGEIPGDRADRAGHVFVGPAGRELDRALEIAGLERDEAYVTNAVKHFKFEESDLAGLVTATAHPSAILRARDEAAREALRSQMAEDLRVVAEFLAG